MNRIECNKRVGCNVDGCTNYLFFKMEMLIIVTLLLFPIISLKLEIK